MVTQDDIKRIEAKLDQLLEIFAGNRSPDRSKKQIEDIAKKSVLDFQERSKAKGKNGRAKNK